MNAQAESAQFGNKSHWSTIVLSIDVIGFFSQPVPAAQPVGLADVKALHPFTQWAFIPATADPATVKFERIKVTTVNTKATATESADCANLQFRDPDGSMYCPFVEFGAPATAYEVIYSYRAQPMASDEYGGTYFTFEVYFRPEELPAGLIKAVASRRLKRAELATYFSVTISPAHAEATVIDLANSKCCEGYYVDGNWMLKNHSCQDKVTFKKAVVPSTFLQVRVDPITEARSR